MPEAVKEEATDISVPPQPVAKEDIPPNESTGEANPAEASSGTLPVNEENLTTMEVEGEEAPMLVEAAPEEGKSEGNLTIEEMEKELIQFVQTGREAVLNMDFYAAAEAFSKACEYSATVYGDMAEQCAENYFLYGSSLLECGKTENNVLGEKVKQGEEEDEEEQMEFENGQGKEHKAEVAKNGNNEVKENGSPTEEKFKQNGDKKELEQENGVKKEVDEEKPGSSVIDNMNGDESTAENGEKDEEEEDDDNSLRIAWEVFELAKVIFQRTNNEKRLADTYLKLGEIGIESGHTTAMDDMKKSLSLREKLFPDERIVSETHFNIGLAYSSFQLFDDAIKHFELSKNILKAKVEHLLKKDTNEAKDEIKEIKELLPELDDKIQDMKDSKSNFIAVVRNTCAALNVSGSPGASSSTDNKPVSNISHLIKRKRKLDELASDLPAKSAKQPCTDEGKKNVETPISTTVKSEETTVTMEVEDKEVPKSEIQILEEKESVTAPKEIIKKQTDIKDKSQNQTSPKPKTGVQETEEMEAVSSSERIPSEEVTEEETKTLGKDPPGLELMEADSTEDQSEKLIKKTQEAVEKTEESIKKTEGAVEKTEKSTEEIEELTVKSIEVSGEKTVEESLVESTKKLEDFTENSAEKSSDLKEEKQDDNKPMKVEEKGSQKTDEKIPIESNKQEAVKDLKKPETPVEPSNEITSEINKTIEVPVEIDKNTKAQVEKDETSEVSIEKSKDTEKSEELNKIVKENTEIIVPEAKTETVEQKEINVVESTSSELANENKVEELNEKTNEVQISIEKETEIKNMLQSEKPEKKSTESSSELTTQAKEEISSCNIEETKCEENKINIEETKTLGSTDTEEIKTETESKDLQESAGNPVEADKEKVKEDEKMDTD